MEEEKKYKDSIKILNENLEKENRHYNESFFVDNDIFYEKEDEDGWF